MNIIQHHDNFNFEAFFQKKRTEYIGMDFDDFTNFISRAGEVHSFMATSDLDNRVGRAITGLLANDSVAAELATKAKAAAVIILCSAEADRQLTVGEVGYIAEFAALLPEGCDVDWTVADSDCPDVNAVTTIILFSV